MTTPRYHPALDERIILTSSCRLHYTGEISADFAGGPPGWIPGQMWLTDSRFVFRPAQEPARFWKVTVDREDVRDVAVVPGDGDTPHLRVSLRSLRGTLPCDIALVGDDGSDAQAVDRWAEALRAPPSPRGDAPRERLAAALARDERDRHRYVDTLYALSFPRGFWNVDAVDDMRDVCGACLQELGIDDDDRHWREAEAIAERFAVEPGPEGPARRAQIESVVASIGERGGRRFRRYAEDIDDWPHAEPVWLWVSDDEDARLRELEVVRSPD